LPDRVGGERREKRGEIMLLNTNHHPDSKKHEGSLYPQENGREKASTSLQNFCFLLTG